LLVLLTLLQLLSLRPLLWLILSILYSVLDVLLIMFCLILITIVIQVIYSRTVLRPMIITIVNNARKTMPESEFQVIMILISLSLSVLTWLYQTVVRSIISMLLIQIFLFVKSVLPDIIGTLPPINVF
jgi:hypothetical protein